MRKFYELFDVVESEVQEDNEDFWRVFNREYSPEILDQVPADTTLRHRFLEFLRTGRIMGNGYGILLFDGEKILGTQKPQPFRGNRKSTLNMPEESRSPSGVFPWGSKMTEMPG